MGKMKDLVNKVKAKVAGQKPPTPEQMESVKKELAGIAVKLCAMIVPGGSVIINCKHSANDGEKGERVETVIISRPPVIDAMTVDVGKKMEEKADK